MSKDLVMSVIRVVIITIVLTCLILFMSEDPVMCIRVVHIATCVIGLILSLVVFRRR